jgi:hypothetical protein
MPSKGVQDFVTLDNLYFVTGAKNNDGTQVSGFPGHDNVTGLQAVLNAGKKTIRFPYQSSPYEISDSIAVGSFSIDGRNNVRGWAGKTGVSFIAEGFGHGGSNVATLKWIGASQPGTTTANITDSVGTYTIVTDDKAMISCVGSQGLNFEGLILDGDNKAYTGIDFQGTHTIATLKRLIIKNVVVGVRDGRSYNHETGATYWGYGNNPYLKANVINVPFYGGWQGDTKVYDACSFYGTKASYSCESGQNISIVQNACNYQVGKYGIVVFGGRLTLNGPAFLRGIGTKTADIYWPSGTNFLTINHLHTESGATFQLQTSSNPVSQSVTVTVADKFHVFCPGGGMKGSFTDIDDFALTRLDVNARLDVTITNSHIRAIRIANTGARSNVNITCINCNIDADALSALKAANGYLAIIGPDAYFSKQPQWGTQ